MMIAGMGERAGLGAEIFLRRFTSSNVFSLSQKSMTEHEK